MSKNLIGFRAGKAAQVSAYFAIRSGGTIDKLKLSKLLYLCERESMAARGRPMFYDEFYSLKDGPIASCALDGINGKRTEGVWAKFVCKLSNRTIKSAVGISEESLEELSRSDQEILERLWSRHGWMASNVIRKWTHDPKNCPEYVEVSDGRLPIKYRDVFMAVGYDDPADLETKIDEYRNFEAVSSRRD